jgi:hypothetical protein
MQELLLVTFFGNKVSQRAALHDHEPTQTEHIGNCIGPGCLPDYLHQKSWKMYSRIRDLTF